jgi:hypothetical protein
MGFIQENTSNPKGNFSINSHFIILDDVSAAVGSGDIFTIKSAMIRNGSANKKENGRSTGADCDILLNTIIIPMSTNQMRLNTIRTRKRGNTNILQMNQRSPSGKFKTIPIRRKGRLIIWKTDCSQFEKFPIFMSFF